MLSVRKREIGEFHVDFANRSEVGIERGNGAIQRGDRLNFCDLAVDFAADRNDELVESVDGFDHAAMKRLADFPDADFLIECDLNRSAFRYN